MEVDIDSRMSFRKLVKCEDNALSLLRQQKVLFSSMKCPGKNGNRCDAIMKERKRKSRGDVWRCPRYNCRKELSVRFGCSFFSHESSKFRHFARLPLNEILEIMHMFVLAPTTIRQAANYLNHSTKTIMQWWHLCRDVCTSTLDRQPLFMGTPNSPIQIDESFFSGRRKYNRGRLQIGDTTHRSTDFELEGWHENQHEGAIFNEDVAAWLWVVGIYESRTRLRFIRVQDRTQRTLKLVINKYVQPGSVVWTDSFSAYNSYSLEGYIHEKVNHSENFVAPGTGVHTQGIERAWVDAKVWYKRARGNRVYLQSHLDEAAWRKLRSSELNQKRLFLTFLEDLRATFSKWE